MGGWVDGWMWTCWGCNRSVFGRLVEKLCATERLVQTLPHNQPDSFFHPRRRAARRVDRVVVALRNHTRMALQLVPCAMAYRGTHVLYVLHVFVRTYVRRTDVRWCTRSPVVRRSSPASISIQQAISAARSRQEQWSACKCRKKNLPVRPSVRESSQDNRRPYTNDTTSAAEASSQHRCG
jgi:hypothetical protein